AQEFQADLHLAHVVEPPLYDDLIKPSESKEPFRKRLRKTVQEKLTSMVPEEARTWCNPVTALLAGQPHEELIKYAVVNDMDLVVLGVRGHSLVETLLVGSTTGRVMRGAPCPVLSVQPMSHVK
ncbi:MAG: universal stress protein, partial [Deltaproteobacteria bacterium]|nr:universal stress protein [Deltaproteobacteria bacterium]